MDVKKRIEELRKERNLTIYELTFKSDLSENTIYHWYSQQTSPSLKAISSICRALDITVEEFFNPQTKESLTLTEQDLLEMFSRCTKEEQQAVLTLLKMKDNRELKDSK